MDGHAAGRAIIEEIWPRPCQFRSAWFRTGFVECCQELRYLGDKRLWGNGRDLLSTDVDGLAGGSMDFRTQHSSRVDFAGIRGSVNEGLQRNR